MYFLAAKRALTFVPSIKQTKAMMNRILFLLFTGISMIHDLQGQSLQVYPGDANNNGVVNNVDFLSLGLAYNFIGPERDSATGNGLTFLPQPAMPWAYNFSNGVNFAYADCNGDGVVNYYYDAFPIYVNYGEQRPDNVTPDVFTPGLEGVDPAVHFDPAAVPQAVNGGQQFSLPILLGDAQHPVEDLYGLAFSVFVDPQVIEASDVNFNFSELSWANPDNDRIFLYKKVSPERIDVSWVRTDHNQRDGFGRIGTADFIIIIDVIGIQESFDIRIDSIRMIDKYGNQTTMAGDTVTVNMTDDAVSAEHTPGTDSAFRVQPNPAGRHLRVSSAEVVEQVILLNALGQTVWQATPGRPSADFELPLLPSGVYWLSGRTESGLFMRKIQIKQ